MLIFLAVCLNVFSINGAASIYLPYLADYLKKYIKAAESHVGLIALLSNFFGMPIGVLLSNMSDRYRCHRRVYIATIVVLSLNFGIFLLPMIHVEPDSKAAENHTQSTNPSTLDLLENYDSDIGESSKWSEIISANAILTSILLTFSLNISDTFCANLALKTNVSYGSIRFCGGAAWVFTSLLLCFINDIKCLPYLLPAMTTCTLLLGSIIVVLFCCPDQSGFDLAAVDSPDGGRVGPEDINETTFNFKRYFYSCRTIENCKSDLETSDVMTKHNNSAKEHHNSIEFTKMNVVLSFDSNNEPNLDRNSRRLSMNPHSEPSTVRNTFNQLDKGVSDHFKFVSKVDISNSGERKAIEQTKIPSNGEAETPQARNSCDQDLDFSFLLSLRLIWMLIKSRKEILKFFAIYFACGFLSSMSYYRVQYLEYLDPNNYRKLAPRFMLSAFLSETCFYLVSPYVTKHLKYSTSLTLVLFCYGLRYSLYLLFIYFPGYLPLDLFILIEMLHSITTGLFFCVLYVSALEFAQEAGCFVIELVELGIIERSDRAEERVKNGIKVTMVSLASCCFDGLGIGLGSYLGGKALDKFGFPKLWIWTTSFAFGVGLVNLSYDTYLKFKSNS